MQIFRKAIDKDIISIVDFIKEVPELLEMPNLPFNEQKTLLMIRETVGKNWVFLSEENGIINGVLGLIKTSFWWSTSEFYMNSIFFVRPEKRSFKIAERLLKMAKSELEDAPFILDFIGSSEESLSRKSNWAKRKLKGKVFGMMING